MDTRPNRRIWLRTVLAFWVLISPLPSYLFLRLYLRWEAGPAAGIMVVPTIGCYSAFIYGALREKFPARIVDRYFALYLFGITAISPLLLTIWALYVRQLEFAAVVGVAGLLVTGWALRRFRREFHWNRNQGTRGRKKRGT